MGKLKKLGIGFIIVVLILLVVDNVKYLGLTAGQIEYSKMIFDDCTELGLPDCEWAEQKIIDSFKQSNR